MEKSAHRKKKPFFCKNIFIINKYYLQLNGKYYKRNSICTLDYPYLHVLGIRIY